MKDVFKRPKSETIDLDDEDGCVKSSGLIKEPVLKKPKIENGLKGESSGSGERREQFSHKHAALSDHNEEKMDKCSEEFGPVDEEDLALVALIEHRSKEVEHLTNRVAHYSKMLEDAKKSLHNTKEKLIHLRKENLVRSKAPCSVSSEFGTDGRKTSTSDQSKFPVGIDQSLYNVKPQLVIPSASVRVRHPMKLSDDRAKASLVSAKGGSAQDVPHSHSVQDLKEETSRSVSLKKDTSKVKTERASPKLEQKEHRDLVSSIGTCSSSGSIRIQTLTYLPSQHKRKLRSLELSPMSDQLFVTSALDGVVNLWQVTSKGNSVSLLSSTDCLSPKQRRWPEDIAWHPFGDRLFAAYTADDDDFQVAVLNLNSFKEKRVVFLEGKPHGRGIINSLNFLPWDDIPFATGGSDHAVVLWTENNGVNTWKPKVLHRNLHTSAIMGVAGLRQRHMVLSAGVDKRIFGFDVLAVRAEYKYQIDCKCLGVLPSPADFNLFMVQTGAPEAQLRLFDIRQRQTEIQRFGWKQDSSETQSALVNQAWSPDGLYITSGSADPAIHIFDIRFKGHTPQSFRAHQKRVFKAAWDHTLPILISISSDLQIGVHKVA